MKILIGGEGVSIKRAILILFILLIQQLRGQKKVWLKARLQRLEKYID